MQESSDSFEFTVYAGILGIPENFMVLGSDPEKDSLIFTGQSGCRRIWKCVRVMCIYHIQIIEVGTHLERILIIGNYRWKSGDGVGTFADRCCGLREMVRLFRRKMR